jgi:hypothetical protein
MQSVILKLWYGGKLDETKLDIAVSYGWINEDIADTLKAGDAIE